VALQGELGRAAAKLATASPRSTEGAAFDKALAAITHLENELARFERAANALEQLFGAQARLARLGARLERLTFGAAPEPYEERLPPLDATAARPEAADLVGEADIEPAEEPTPEIASGDGDEATPAEGVIDLQNAMVQRLREQVERLREERSALIINGRNNLASMIRVHQAVLGLLDAESYEDFLVRLNQELPRIIDIPVIVLGIERSGPVAVTPELANIRLLADGKVESLFGPQRKLLLRRDIAGDRDLYGALAEEVSSDALVRLNLPSSGSEAVLAFGADDPNYFDDDQGTELLTFLGRTIETLIGTWSAQGL
jgi:uncharacterized protein YigA (DUF484 family)